MSNRHKSTSNAFLSQIPRRKHHRAARITAKNTGTTLSSDWLCSLHQFAQPRRLKRFQRPQRLERFRICGSCCSCASHQYNEGAARTQAQKASRTSPAPRFCLAAGEGIRLLILFGCVGFVFQAACYELKSTKLSAVTTPKSVTATGSSSR